jgi:two-component system, cell cycle sensor histidine kinase and response regulator CckA
METNTTSDEVSSLRVEVAALNELLEVHEKVVSEQSAKLEQAFRQLREESKLREKTITELKEAKRELGKNLLYTRSLIEASLDPLVTINPDGKIMDLNQATVAITGVSREELIGQDFSDSFTEPEKAREGYQQVFSQGLVRDFPLAIQHGSGRVTDVIYNASIYINEAGEVQGVVATARDITERKRSEEAGAAEHQRLFSLLETMPAFVGLLTPDYQVVFVNHYFKERFGEPGGRRCYEYIHGRSDPCENCQAYKVLETKTPEEYERSGPDGRTYQMRNQLMHDTDGSPLILEMGIDITERKQAEEALRVSEEHYHIAAETSNDLIYEWDLKQNLQWPDRIDEILGYGPAEFSRTLDGWMESVHPEDIDHLKASIKAHLEGRVPFVEEYRIRRKNGVYSWWSARGDTSMSPDGTPVRWIGTVTDITERKLAVEDLRASEEKFRAIFDHANDGILLADGETLKFALANKKICEMLGYSIEEIQNLGVNDIHPRGTLPDVIEQFKGHVKGIAPYSPELPVQRKDGSVFYADINSVPMMLAGKRYVLGIFRDITERKQAEEALKHMHHQYQLILSSAADGILGLDPEGKFVFVNPAAARMLGYEAEELIGFTSHAIWHHARVNGSPYPEEDCPIYEVLNEGTPYLGFDDVFWRKDGTSFTVDYATAPIIEDGKVNGAVVTFWDISKRQEAEEAFKSLVSQAPMGIFIIQGTKFVLINPGFETITGYRKEDLLGREPKCLAIPSYKEFVREEAIKRLKGKDSTPFAFQFKNQSGETRWGLETIASTQFGGKRAILGYLMDITENKQLEDQLLHAQKMEAVGTLAGGIAHDFNNMLGVIMGYCDLMSLKFHQDDPLTGPLSEIRKAAERAAALTRQLLAFSRKQIQRPQVLNLNDQLAGMQKMVERLIGEDIEMTIVLDPSLAPVKADPGQIEQIIMNLVINARDAMPQGGKLTLETDNVYLDQGYTQKYANVTPGPYVMLAVSDNGQGIDAETQARMFEPFFTTKEVGKGTGLGLSTVYGIIKQSAGHIQAYSEIGQGATFKVYLPQVEESVSEIPTAKSLVTGLYGSETVLVVEDDDMLKKFICASLDMYGYKVLEARHGDEALLRCKQHPEPIHLMLTDVVMPKMSGRELADRLAPLRPDMKVLYMSGYTENVIVHHGVLDSSLTLIQKPFSPRALAEQIRKILDEAVRQSQCSARP